MLQSHVIKDNDTQCSIIETALSEIENHSWQMIVPLSLANLQILLTLLSDYISIYVFVKLLMLLQGYFRIF